MTELIEQDTAEWFESRVGRVTASRIYDVTAKTKSGAWTTAREKYLAQLAVERLTGIPTQHFVSSFMQWGIDMEPDARAAYEYLMDVDVMPIGFVQHPTILQSGATPDGAVGDAGLVEFKCPQSITHIETIRTKEIDPQYIAQMAWQLACSGREWVDYGTYDPRMPPELRLWVFRYQRDEKYIAQLETQVREFLAELEELVTQLKAIGRIAA